MIFIKKTIVRIIKKVTICYQKMILEMQVFDYKGNNVHILEGTKLVGTEHIWLEDNTYIGRDCRLYAQGGIKICTGSILADNIEIRTANHTYNENDLRSLPYDDRVEYKKVIVGKNVWICSCVLILPGVSIGEGAVIAAGAVVTKDVPPFSVVGGNPAKVLKYRDGNIYKKLNDKNQQYMTIYYNKKLGEKNK